TLLYEDSQNMDLIQIRDFAKLLNQSSKKAYELLENLLEWARSQTGKIEFKPMKLDLKELLSGCTSFLEQPAANKQISLVLDCRESIYVVADKNMLNLIVRNLLTNAIKFSYLNSTIKITVYIQDKFCFVSIKDSGIGISDEDLKNLFKIDVKVSRNGTSNEQGSGLGLVLCKEFIEINGGNLLVESQPGKGSEFIFTLPLYNPLRID
ncbi:MAG: sensor histidine kinase, partial [Methanococcaceae archaeon]